MAQVIVSELTPEVVATLTRRAQSKGRSLEEELRVILTEAARSSRAEILAEMDRLQAMTPPGPPIDVVALIREVRDER
jgi:plasmid stability protein